MSQLKAMRQAGAALVAARQRQQEALPADVVRLVFAARKVAFDTPPTIAALRELDHASEAFASRVPWDDEPEDDAVEGHLPVDPYLQTR